MQKFSGVNYVLVAHISERTRKPRRVVDNQIYAYYGPVVNVTVDLMDVVVGATALFLVVGYGLAVLIGDRKEK
jgi:hypothetical protein